MRIFFSSSPIRKVTSLEKNREDMSEIVNFFNLFQLTCLTVVSIESRLTATVITTRIPSTVAIVMAWRAGTVVNYKRGIENHSEQKFIIPEAYVFEYRACRISADCFYLFC